MLKKFFTALILTVSVCVALPVAAGGARIISQMDAAEADKIQVFTDRNGNVDRIYVEGCVKCPLRLVTNKQTRFSYDGKAVKEKEAKSYSLKTGTVIFDAEKKLALKVNW